MTPEQLAASNFGCPIGAQGPTGRLYSEFPNVILDLTKRYGSNGITYDGVPDKLKRNFNLTTSS